jgi:hypothetical protein
METSFSIRCAVAPGIRIAFSRMLIFHLFFSGLLVRARQLATATSGQGCSEEQFSLITRKFVSGTAYCLVALFQCR